MASTSIDGLVSGLDTTSIVNQLIALERAPADRLAKSKTTADAKATAYGGLRSRVDAVKTAFQALDAASDWSPAKATSSNADAVTAIASAGAKPTSLSFEVLNLASAHTVVSSGAAKAAGATWSGASLTLNVDGVDRVLTVEPDEQGVFSLAQVTSAINASDVGVNAQAVQVGPGQYRLQLTAAETGAASQFSVVSGFVDTFDVALAGQDARLEMAGGLYQATSPTNTFDDLLPGVDVTVKATTTAPVTVSVTTDSDAIANKVQSLVNAVNGVVANVKTLTAYNATAKTAALLNGDRTVQRLSQELTRAFIDPVSGGAKVPSQLGITLGKDGSFSFDKVKFHEALADNPSAVQALFVQAEGAPDNVTTRLAGVATAAAETGTGYLRTAEESQRARVSAFTNQIETIERRLERSATKLRKQFSAMETALSTMKSQSNWLAGQIAGLATNSSG